MGSGLRHAVVPFVCLPFVGRSEASHKIFQPKIFYFFFDSCIVLISPSYFIVKKEINNPQEGIEKKLDLLYKSRSNPPTSLNTSLTHLLVVSKNTKTPNLSFGFFQTFWFD